MTTTDELAIRVSGVGKSYRIGALQERYGTLRESIMSAPGRLVGNRSREEFWALRNVDFEVPAGEVLGIIGSNGAGKSTLLKVLARITEPTEGSVDIWGRIGSLLEVGSGFNLELSGRENVFLNGAILGMRRREIEQKFEEIVAFAEVEQFIETPVKRYSSGMYMRLAFAVAAHLEPEILLIDEVLAVGDAKFQQKCLGKMGEVAGDGRTVIFVSHNLAAVQNLCQRVIWLENGTVRMVGPAAETVAAYLRAHADDGGDGVRRTYPPPAPPMQAGALWCELRQSGMATTELLQGQPFEMVVGLRVLEPLGSLRVAASFYDHLGTRIATIDTRESHQPFEVEPREAIAVAEVPSPRLMPGRYHVDLVVGTDHQEIQALRPAISFGVAEQPVYATGRSPHPASGVVYLDHTWRFEDDLPDLEATEPSEPGTSIP